MQLIMFHKYKSYEMNLKGIFNKLKARGIDTSVLSAEDIADMAIDEPTNNINYDIDSIVHNKSKLADVINDNISLKNQLAEQQKAIENLTSATKTQIDELIQASANKQAQYDELIQKYENDIKQKLEQDNATKVQSIIDKAINDKRLPVENKDLQDKYKKMLLSDFETASSIIDGLPSLEVSNTATNTSQTHTQVATNPRTVVGSGVNPKILEYVNTNVVEN